MEFPVQISPKPSNILPVVGESPCHVPIDLLNHTNCTAPRLPLIVHFPYTKQLLDACPHHMTNNATLRIT